MSAMSAMPTMSTTSVTSASLAALVEFPELPVGRLDARTVHRISTATTLHHRAGPWAPCPEDTGRLLRVGTGLRAPADLGAGEDDTAPVTDPITLHRRSQRALA